MMTNPKIWNIEDIEEIGKEVYNADLTPADATIILEQLDIGMSISGDEIVWETVVDFTGEFIEKREGE